MNKTLLLLYLHVWIIFWVTFCTLTIWGRMAEKTYASRMRWVPWLMPGKLKDKNCWVKQQKVLAWIGLIVGLLVYILSLLSMIKG